MDLKEIGVNIRKWIDSTQDRDSWKTLVFSKTWSQFNYIYNLFIYYNYLLYYYHFGGLLHSLMVRIFPSFPPPYVVLIDSLHLHSEANLLIQHIIVQDQDGQNNNTPSISNFIFKLLNLFISTIKYRGFLTYLMHF